MKEQIFGIYELDNAGTILYSRPYETPPPSVARPSIVGQNFFDEVTDGENAECLRRHFKTFLSSRRSVDSFVFEDAVRVKTRVLMTRGHETQEHDPAAGIVIIDIKKYTI